MRGVRPFWPGAGRFPAAAGAGSAFPPQSPGVTGRLWPYGAWMGIADGSENGEEGLASPMGELGTHPHPRRTGG